MSARVVRLSTEKRLNKEAERIALNFSGEKFSSKNDVANWMRRESNDLEKKGFKPLEIFQILKIVGEKRKR